jgi:hypothetical protein
MAQQAMGRTRELFVRDQKFANAPPFAIFKIIETFIRFEAFLLRQWNKTIIKSSNA